MPTIAELTIKVNTTDLDRANKALDSLSKTSSGVERSTQKASEGIDQVAQASNRATTAQERLIARAKEQVATFGQGSAGVLEYRAGLLGVSAAVDPLVSQLRNLKVEQQAAVAAQKEQAAVSKEIERSKQQLSASQYRMIESLREEIALFGKSKDEILLYRAGLMGISDQVEPLVAELKRLKDAKEQEAQAGKVDNSAAARRQAEKDALAAKAKELEKVIALERERIRAANAETGETQKTREAEAALTRYSQKLDDVRAQEAELAAKQRASRQALEEQARSFRQLSASIDPATEAVRRLDEQQDMLNAAFERSRSGKGPYIARAEYDRLNGIIETSRKRISDLGAQTGKTAKEINFAMRGLPAQFTDIFVSLQGGQAPLTVFLQQGGQIKDMFGGIGPALRAMGGYILSLINPLSVAAAAMGTLAVGFVLGAKESSSFNKSLISTGNAAGTTAGNLLNLTEQLDNSLTTSGKAAQVLNQIAASGKITEASFGRVAEAAIRWEKATGTATDETVKAFVSLRGDPVKAVEELDEKYNFLTGSVYQQIAALQEQNRTAEATALAEQELANAFVERSKQIEQNLGYIERAWNFVASAAKEGWDAILDVGRQDSPQKMLSDLYGELNDFGRAAFARNNPDVNIQKEITKLWAEIADAESQALIERTDKRIKDESVQGQKYINSLKTRVEKEKDELQKLERSVAAARRDGIEISEKEIADARAAIQEKYARRKPKTPVVREEAGNRLLAQMKQQEASLTQQLDSSTKISSEETKLIKLKEQIAQIEQKNLNEKLTKEQASILANKEALLAQQQKNVEIQKEIQAQKELARLETIRTATANQLAADQQKYQDQVVGAGRSDKEVERMKERLTLQREYNRQMEQLSRDRRNKEISEETYQAGAQEYKRSLDERTAALEASYEKMDQLQSDWSVGASKAWENYLEEGRNVAGLTQGFFTSAFSTIEDSLVNFVTTGKLSFKDLTVSILKDLAAMATKIAANQILMSIIGSFGGAAAGAASGAGAAATTNTGASFAGYAAKGKAFSGGVEFFANGGAFTNSIVNTPTAFATNSGMGVMGEAGPEAIMPLTRTSGGQLGVRMAGGATSTVVAPVSVTVNTDGGNGQSGGVGNNTTETQGRAVQQAIKSEVEKTIQQSLQPGGTIWKSMNNR